MSEKSKGTLGTWLKDNLPNGITIGIQITCFVFLFNQISSLSTNVQADIRGLHERIDQVNARSDQLYSMFIDLLKEGRR